MSSFSYILGMFLQICAFLLSIIARKSHSTLSTSGLFLLFPQICVILLSVIARKSRDLPYRL